MLSKGKLRTFGHEVEHGHCHPDCCQLHSACTQQTGQTRSKKEATKLDRDAVKPPTLARRNVCECVHPGVRQAVQEAGVARWHAAGVRPIWATKSGIRERRQGVRCQGQEGGQRHRRHLRPSTSPAKLGLQRLTQQGGQGGTNV